VLRASLARNWWRWAAFVRIGLQMTREESSALVQNTGREERQNQTPILVRMLRIVDLADGDLTRPGYGNRRLLPGAIADPIQSFIDNWRALG